MSQQEQLVLNIQGVSLGTSQFWSWRNQVFHWKPSPHGICFADSFDIISLQCSTHVTESFSVFHLSVEKPGNEKSLSEYWTIRRIHWNQERSIEQTHSKGWMNKNKMAALIKRRLFFVPKWHFFKTFVELFYEGRINRSLIFLCPICIKWWIVKCEIIV